MDWSSFATSMGDLSHSVISDLGAVGVFGTPRSTVGGHATTQVPRTVQNTGAAANSQVSQNTTSTQTLVLVGAAIVLIIGLFLLMKKKSV